MASVSLRGIRKQYDGNSVIKGIDLTIEDGEFVVFVGPSGCGKSTLLRIIAGLEDISEGILEIGGRVSNDIEPARRGIAMVFQSYALYPHMTVAENIGYPLRIRGLAKADQRAGAARVAESLEISHLLDRRPRHLSGGQRQRVALARALVREPDLLLLDEPFSALDALTRVSAQRLVSELWERHRPAVLFVTHDVEEALLLSDRVLLLDDGRLAYDEPFRLPRPRRRDDPELVERRSELLTRLGVQHV
jgi:multiple sugar transport system ATP-binding protein